MRTSRICIRWFLIVIVSLARLLQFAEAKPGAFPPKWAARTLVYTMRGEVRLLLFWIGRDEVGGGWVSSRCGMNGDTGESWRETEVLFGSNPERVPGGINRWGYGREKALWSRESGKTGASLLSTHFSGVMRHSKEESISQTLENERNQKSEERYLFDAIQSTVLPASAHSQIHIFAHSEEFDYRCPDEIIAKLQDIFSFSPPHEVQELKNESNLYVSPYGFLTGLTSLIEQIANSASPRSEDWKSEKPSLIYVYDSKPYRLEVLKIRKPETYYLSSNLVAQGFPKQVSRTSEIQFRIENLTENQRHDFTLWVPLEGSLRKTPLRIMYQPRWWLRVKLDLISIRD